MFPQQRITVNDKNTLPDGVELVKSDIFWPEGRFYFCRCEFVWSKAEAEDLKREDTKGG
jgi:hypothetical protein